MQYKLKTLAAALAIAIGAPCAAAANDVLLDAAQPAKTFVVTPEGEELTLSELIERSQIDINEVVQLPIRNLSAVHSNEGHVRFISDNGRYVIVGELIDVWESRVLRTMKDIKDSVRNSGLKKQLDTLGDTLNSAVVGQGAKKNYVFVDANCDACKKYIKDAQDFTAKASDYSFEFVVIPAMGDESHRLATKFFCSQDGSEQKLNALISGSIPSLNAQDCDLENYERTVLAAHLIGVDGVPFTVSYDDRVYRGTPESLEQWFGEQVKEQAK